MKITFLGTSHGVPAKDRFCSGYMIEAGDATYLVDAGAPVADLVLRHGKQITVLKNAHRLFGRALLKRLSEEVDETVASGFSVKFICMEGNKGLNRFGILLIQNVNVVFACLRGKDKRLSEIHGLGLLRDTCVWNPFEHGCDLFCIDIRVENTENRGWRDLDKIFYGFAQRRHSILSRLLKQEKNMTIFKL